MEAQTRWLALIGIILLVGALYFTRAVTMPLGFAVFLAMLVWPLQRRFEELLPGPAAFAATLVVVLGLAAGFVGGLIYCVGEISEQLPMYLEAIRSLGDRLGSTLQSAGLPLPDMPESVGTEGLVDAASLAGQAIETVLLVGILLVLGLAEAQETMHRLRDEVDPEHRAAVLDIGGEIARRFRRYFFTRTFTGAVTAVLTAIICWAMDVDPPLVWGILSFLLYYVPAVGHIIAVILPSVAALAIHGAGWGLAVTGVLGVVQVGMGNYVDPKLLGQTLEMSPVVVLFSVVFWGFVWGLGGALLGVPITVAMIVVMGRFDQTRWIAVLLGGGAAATGRTAPTLQN